MAVEKSDWSKISTDDLITLNEAFEHAVEHEDGTYSIHLNDVHWPRCFAIKYEIAHELQERDAPP
jgi:plasmid maintenance system killer protein